MKKKILFCAEDFGGIKSLFPIYIYLKKKFECKFITNNNFYCEVTKKKILPINKKDLLILAKKFSPDVVFSGSSEGKYSIDKLLLNSYRNNNEVKKIIVFEEWHYNYKKAIIFNNDYLKIDTYLVNDKFCYHKAIKEGLEKKKLFVACQFHLSNLFYNVKHKKKSSNNILFLYEDIQKKTKIKNIKHPGYSTKQVLKDLIKVHSLLKLNSKILVKKHPSRKGKFNILEKELKNKFVKYVYSNEIIKFMLNSKIIVGMRSMAILESIVLKCPVISYQPNSFFERCSAVNLGLIKSLKTFIELKKNISSEKRIYASSKKLSFIKKIDSIKFDKII